jgi:hypothetical protein
MQADGLVHSARPTLSVDNTLFVLFCFNKFLINFYRGYNLSSSLKKYFNLEIMPHGSVALQSSAQKTKRSLTMGQYMQYVASKKIHAVRS